MSLSAILDDIQEGAMKPLESQSDNTPLVVQDPALEHLQGLVVVLERAKVLGRYVHLQRAFKTAVGSGMVDRATALELFTMLPIQSEVTPILTHAPSEHNRGVLLGVQRNVVDKDAELTVFTREVCELIEKSLPLAKELTALCDAYLASITTQLKRLYDNPPTVVVDGVNTNLLECDVHMVANLDTHALHYPPYAGTLDVHYKAVAEDTVLRRMQAQGLMVLEPSGVCSLNSVALHLLQVCGLIVRQEKDIKTILLNLRRTTLAGNIPYSASLIEESLLILTSLNSEQALFVGKDCLAQKTLDCLSFLT